jgi:transposase
MPHQQFTGVNMANFIDTNINQTIFLDINFLDQLGKNTFDYYLYTLLSREGMLDDFNDRYKNAAVGRKAYPPELLLRVIFSAYYRGITSSRAMARLCESDLTFMALAVGHKPHHTTLADFISQNTDAIKTLFHKVLLVCDESGLIGKEHFAVDGCKLPTDASKEWSGKFSELEKKSKKMRARAERIVKRHLESDADKSKDNGHYQKDKQTVDTLLKNADKIDRFLKDNNPRQGHSKSKSEVQSNITDNESCKMTTSKGTIQGMTCVTAADEKHQIVIEAKAFGVGQEQITLKPMVENIEKQFSQNPFENGCVLTADTGFCSEDNLRYLSEKKVHAVIPDNQFRLRDPVYSDSETFRDHKEKRQKTRKDTKGTREIFASDAFAIDFENKEAICPNGKKMIYLGDDFETTSGPHIRFRGHLKDCRDCPLNQKCMKRDVKKQGRQISVLIESKRKVSHLDKMRKVIDSDDGKAFYSRRMHTIEPVFGNICSNKRLNKLSLRGEKKVTAQWQLYCMVHNVEKLWRYAA